MKLFFSWQYCVFQVWYPPEGDSHVIRRYREPHLPAASGETVPQPAAEVPRHTTQYPCSQSYCGFIALLGLWRLAFFLLKKSTKLAWLFKKLFWLKIILVGSSHLVRKRRSTKNLMKLLGITLDVCIKSFFEKKIWSEFVKHFFIIPPQSRF